MENQVETPTIADLTDEIADAKTLIKACFQFYENLYKKIPNEEDLSILGNLLIRLENDISQISKNADAIYDDLHQQRVVKLPKNSKRAA